MDETMTKSLYLSRPRDKYKNRKEQPLNKWIELLTSDDPDSNADFEKVELSSRETHYRHILTRHRLNVMRLNKQGYELNKKMKEINSVLKKIKTTCETLNEHIEMRKSYDLMVKKLNAVKLQCKNAKKERDECLKLRIDANKQCEVECDEVLGHQWITHDATCAYECKKFDAEEGQYNVCIYCEAIGNGCDDYFYDHYIYFENDTNEPVSGVCL